MSPRQPDFGNPSHLDTLLDDLADRIAARIKAPTATPPGPLLSPDELAAALAVSRDTVDRLCPPYVPVGGRKRYELGEVRAWLTQRAAADDRDFEPGVVALSRQRKAVAQ